MSRRTFLCLLAMLGTPLAFISWLVRNDKPAPTVSAPPVPNAILRPYQVWLLIGKGNDHTKWRAWFKNRLVYLDEIRLYQGCIWYKTDLINIKKGDMILLRDDVVYIANSDATSLPSKYPPAPCIAVSCRVAKTADFA